MLCGGVLLKMQTRADQSEALKWELMLANRRLWNGSYFECFHPLLHQTSHHFKFFSLELFSKASSVWIDSLLANKLMGYLKIYPSCTLSEKSWVSQGEVSIRHWTAAPTAKRPGFLKFSFHLFFVGERRRNKDGRRYKDWSAALATGNLLLLERHLELSFQVRSLVASHRPASLQQILDAMLASWMTPASFSFSRGSEFWIPS